MPDYGVIPGGGRPYGDIFTFNTPYIDRASQQLYIEQKQREQQQQRQQAQLDEEFSRNVAGIRDADVPELTKLYTDWKLSNQVAMKNPEGVKPEQQLEILRKKGEMYKKIAESKAGLAEEEDLRKGIQRNPLDYDDNASDYLMQRRRLPISQFDTYDKIKDAKGNTLSVRDWNTFKYKGTDTDFQKILTTAAGVPKQVYQKEEPVGSDNLQSKITPYLYGNTPAQFKESVLNSLSQHKAGRDAEALISQVSPEVIKSINEEYKAIPLETWKRMGVDKPQELVIRNADSKAEIFATHQAQLYALNNLPKEGTPVFRTNESEKEKAQFNRQLYLAKYRHSLTKGDKDEADLWIDKYVSNITDQSRQTPLQTYKFSNGKEVYGNKIALDPTLNKALGFDAKNPGMLLATTDGKYIVAPYKQKWDEKSSQMVTVKENGTYALDTDRVSEISPEQLKLALGKQAGVKQLNKKMSGGQTPAPKQEIPTGTMQEWLNTPGWDKEKIRKAVKAGKIKVK